MRSDDNTPRDNGVDEELRDAYRRIATETAPSHLDKAVLAAAAAARTPARRGLWRWRRPLAWATMIGLSFAIVLEFNQTGTDLAPSLEETLPQSAPAAIQDATPEVAADEATAPKLPESTPLLAPAPARQEAVDETERAARQTLEDTVATQAEREKRRRDEELETMSAPAAAEPGVSADERIQPSAPGAAETTASPSAEGLRVDTDRHANFVVPQGPVEEPACDAATRADPELWRECIADLFGADRAVEALHEISLFRRTFPDEPPPVPAK